MLSRNIVRASSSSIRALRTQPQKPFSSFVRPSSFLSARSAAPPLSTRLSSRWYSDAAESKPAAKGEDAVKDEATKSASPQAAEVEALKKDLEAKNKEVIDLKVWIMTWRYTHTIFAQLTETDTIAIGQVPSICC
jgi:hypothetical protein